MRDQFEMLLGNLDSGEDVRTALSQLRQILRDSEGDEKEAFLEKLKLEKERLQKVLDDPDPKARKNASLLIGAIPWEGEEAKEFLEALVALYEKEDVLLVRPSIVAGIEGILMGEGLPGDWDDEKVGSVISKRLSQIDTQAMAVEEKKHILEEREVLDRIYHYLFDAVRSGRLPMQSHESLAKRPCILLAKGGPLSLLIARTKEDQEVRQLSFGLQLKKPNKKLLHSLRFYDEKAYEIRSEIPITSEQVGTALWESNLSTYLDIVYEEDADLGFRLILHENLDERKRAGLVRQYTQEIARAFSGRMHARKDAPEVILHLFHLKSGRYLCLCSFPDAEGDRFPYIRKDVPPMPSAISPKKAALFCEALREHFRRDVHVLDPFCGNGTLLIERGRTRSYRSAFGVETSSEAIEIGRAASEKAKMSINFYHRDFFHFDLERPIEELVTEFPNLYGRTPEEKAEFAQQFFSSVKKCTKPQARLFILSNEGNLFKGFARRSSEFNYLKEVWLEEKRSISIMRFQ